MSSRTHTQAHSTAVKGVWRYVLEVRSMVGWGLTGVMAPVLGGKETRCLTTPAEPSCCSDWSKADAQERMSVWGGMSG